MRKVLPSRNPARTSQRSAQLLSTAWLPDTPLGPLSVAVTGEGLARVAFFDDPSIKKPAASETEPADPQKDPAAAFVSAPLLSLALEQIRDYLSGRRQSFDLPIDWSAVPPFQARVLHAASAIPFGQTRTYGDLALELGQPGASRAVGMALAKNPMTIVIPCHRVLGSGGRLQGYSAPDGLNKKIWLLRLEGVLLFG